MSRNRPDHGYPFCGDTSGPSRWTRRKRGKCGLFSGGCGCLGEGRRLGVPGQVWELRFLPSFPLFSKENRSSKNVWEAAWKSQTSFFQTSTAFCRGRKKPININIFGGTVSGTNRNRPWDKWTPPQDKLGPVPGTNRPFSV